MSLKLVNSINCGLNFSTKPKIKTIPRVKGQNIVYSLKNGPSLGWNIMNS